MKVFRFRMLNLSQFNLDDIIDHAVHHCDVIFLKITFLATFAMRTACNLHNLKEKMLNSLINK